MPPRYCCFYLHQRLRLGWARAEAAGMVTLVLADGEPVQQRAENLLYEWPGEPVADEAGALAQLRARLDDLPAQQACLDALHAGLPPGQALAFGELASRVLGAEASGWSRGLLFAALLSDTARFRFSRGEFTPRSREEAAARLERERERRAEQCWVEQARAWVTELAGGRWDGHGEEGREFLAQLRSLLALERRSPHWALLARPLGLHSLHALDVALRLKGWLQTAQAWPDWPAIWLDAANVGRTFPAGPLAAAAVLAAAPPRCGAAYRDFTAQALYTFDGPGTEDFDDGVAILDSDAQGQTVAVAIAEPDPALQPGTPVFEEAAQRMASVYTVEGTFPMLPECLSTQRFSLLAGADREAVLFVLRIEEGDARLQEIVRGRVRVRRNLDYADGRALLDEQPDGWGRLALLCSTLADVRARAGAVIMERREAVLDVRDPRRIGLTEVVRSGPVHQLVEELAILHNREAGRYCRDARLPGIYRVQPRPRRGTGAVDDEPELQAAARFSTRGGPHAGLACDRYIQTTSPIRRFPDLVMQRQIAEHAASGRVSFPDRALLEQWAERADARLAAYDDVSRRIAADWARRYLLQNPARTYDAVVRRRWEGEADRVRIEPLHLPAHCTLPTGARDGDRVRVRVESVNRDQQSVWVTSVE